MSDEDRVSAISPGVQIRFATTARGRRWRQVENRTEDTYRWLCPGCETAGFVPAGMCVPHECDASGSLIVERVSQ